MRKLFAVLLAALLPLACLAQTPQDPTAPDTRVLDARLRALERSAGSGPMIRVNTGAGAYAIFTNPATLTLQADGGYLRAAGSSVLDPPWANPVVWFPSGSGSGKVYADPATLSGDGSSPSLLRRLAWRGALATNGVLGTGLAADPLRLDPSYPGGGGSGAGFPLSADVSFSNHGAAAVGWLAFGASTNRLEANGTNLTYGGAPIGSGSVTNIGWGLSGDGTTNPLSVDVDVVVSLPSTGRVAGASVAWDGDSFESVISPRMAIDASDAISLHGAGALGTLLVGQLLRMDAAVDGQRHVYSCTNELDTSLYATNDFTWLPTGAADHYWTVFVSQGVRGSAGADGENGVGMDGVGNIQYDEAWSATREYVHSETGSAVWVRHAGRVYECVATSSNVSPEAVGATNYWVVAVDKGATGTLVGYTNFLDRGVWSSGTQYETNQGAWYSGNFFLVGPTNQPPPLGVAPTLDPDYVGLDSAYWTALTKRGARGIKGADGDEINSYTVYSLYQSTNSPFANSPSPTNRTPRYVSGSGSSLSMEWSHAAWLGTNVLTSDGTNLFLNGVLFEPGTDLTGSEVVFNISGQAAVTGTWDAVNSRFLLADVPDNSGGAATNATLLTLGGTNIATAALDPGDFWLSGGVLSVLGGGASTGATELVINIAGQAAKTGAVDVGTGRITITDLPDNNSGGGGTSITYNVASESAPCDYSWTNMGGTNYVTVSFGTNGWNQRVPDAIWTNPVVITVSPKTSSSNDACSWLRYTKGGQQLAWNTANGAISTNDIPTSSTTDVTRLRLFSTAGKTNISIRRDY